MRVIELERIRDALQHLDVLETVAAGFVAYARGEAVVPPVGELRFEQPPGEVHIKYGYLRGGASYVIKIASGFYRNPARGLPSSNGMMLVFDRETGTPSALLLDQGLLTDVRTAAAGALAARHLAPHPVRRIGVLGTGIQARLQVEHLAAVTSCREVTVWGRRPEAMARYRRDLAAHGFTVDTAADPAALAARCDLIVTTTPSTVPLLVAGAVRPGTHVTAVGADTPGKQELDAALLGCADLVVVDSLAQCRERGELAHALDAGLIDERAAVALGDVVAGDHPGRRDGDRDAITVADLTGVAVQDIQIATAVVAALEAAP